MKEVRMRGVSPQTLCGPLFLASPVFFLALLFQVYPVVLLWLGKRSRVQQHGIRTPAKGSHDCSLENIIAAPSCIFQQVQQYENCSFAAEGKVTVPPLSVRPYVRYVKEEMWSRPLIKIEVWFFLYLFISI